LYADLGGSDGGLVRIATSKCLFDLDYSRGYPRGFSAGSCRDIGARWVVDAEITHPGRGVLRSARCTGQMDESIHTAWLLAARYLGLLSTKSYEAASKLMSDRTGAVFGATDPRDLDAGAFTLLGGHGMCMSVSVKDDEDHVVLRAEEGCGIKREGKPVHVLVHMINEGGHGWRVKGISAYY
jgi:hypothetical protein